MKRCKVVHHELVMPFKVDLDPAHGPNRTQNRCRDVRPNRIVEIYDYPVMKPCTHAFPPISCRDSSKSVLLRVIAEAELPVVLRPRLPRPAVTLRYVRGWGAGGSPVAQGIARADVLDLRARPVVMIRVLTSRIVPPEPCPCLHHRWSMSSAATWMPPGWPAARTGLS